MSLQFMKQYELKKKIDGAFLQNISRDNSLKKKVTMLDQSRNSIDEKPFEYDSDDIENSQRRRSTRKTRINSSIRYTGLEHSQSKASCQHKTSQSLNLASFLKEYETSVQIS